MLDLSESGAHVDMTQQYRSIPRKLEVLHISLSDKYIDMTNVTHEKMSLPRTLDKASQDHQSEGDQDISHHLQEGKHKVDIT